MKRLITVVAVLAAAYAGYWYVGAQAVKAGARAALTEARANRWGDAGEVTLAGFPSRFDLTFDGPRLQSPDGSIAWAAPVAQLFALSYRPNAIIAWLPPEQELQLDGQSYQIRNEDMRASARFGLATDLPLAEATAVIEAPEIAASSLGPLGKARQLRAALAEAPPLEDLPNAPTYRIGLEALDVDSLLLGAPIPRVTLDAIAALRAPLDRASLEAGEMPRPQQVDLRGLHLDWGGKRLDVTGMLTLDRAGNPDGTLELRTQDWQAWLSEAIARGLIPAKQQILIGSVAQGLAQQSADGALVLPLSFRGGKTYLGPLALGPAPRFW